METEIIVALLFLVTFSLFQLTSTQKTTTTNQGKWELLARSIGVSAMHIQLLPNNKVIVFDRTGFSASNISLPDVKCATLDHCYAHSVEFDPQTRQVRPLVILTDTWCSSGALLHDGMLVQTGGYGLGERVVRSIKPCSDCDWEEDPGQLASPRWYASNQVLPDGKIIIVGGKSQFNYEFLPKTLQSENILYQLPFLKQTRHSPIIPNNLYPFLHLCPDGNLFVFSNDRAILLDYGGNRIVKTYPIIPGGFSHNYPSTGSSVLLPLKLKTSGSLAQEPEVLVCGGALPDSSQKAKAGIYLPATNLCGRMVMTSDNPTWAMEEMPVNRVMGDMLLLPTGDVLIINGAKRGTAGWDSAREPALSPVLYKLNEESSRFDTLKASKIARLYHSTAILLPDGRVLAGGSNPNRNYNFSTLYPTELSIEAFSPPYLSTTFRPSIAVINSGFTNLAYGQNFSVEFDIKTKGDDDKVSGSVYVTMVSPSFTTHSFGMSQRLLVLANLENEVKARNTAGKFVVNVSAPATGTLAPPGYYMLFVIHEGIPSDAVWVHIE